MVGLVVQYFSTTKHDAGTALSRLKCNKRRLTDLLLGNLCATLRFIRGIAARMSVSGLTAGDPRRRVLR